MELQEMKSLTYIAEIILQIDCTLTYSKFRDQLK